MRDDVAEGVVGDLVEQCELVGVTKLDIKAGKLGALAVVGVFDFRVEDASEWNVGDLVYWDPGDGFATKTATGHKLLGKTVLVDSWPGSPHVRVRLSQ